MDIKLFISILLAVSVGVYLIPVENSKKGKNDKDIALVIFEEPLMYTYNDINVSRIVQASKAIRYKNRDEMFDANIILSNSDETKEFQIEKLKADTIIKKNDFYTLINNVKYQRDDFVTLTTNELFYNETKMLAYNNQPFEGTYYEHFIKGTNLYLDGKQKEIKSKNAHFEIDMKKEK